MANESYAHFKGFSASDVSFDERKKIWREISGMTEQAFDDMMAGHKARQADVPPVGTPAPDFRIERLGPGRKRSGEYVQLSALRGRPVALCFGSFT